MDFHYYIYIYILLYIYIFLIIIILGPLLDYLGRVSTSGLRSGALYNLRIVRDVCRGFPLRILPSLDAREPLSLFSISLSHGGSTASNSLHHPCLCAARRISRDEDGRSNRSRSPLTVSFTLLARFFRFWHHARELVLCVATRERSLCVRVPPSPLLHRRRRARKSHAGGRVCATGPLTSYGHM